eukprot:s3830_g3.t1
MEVRSLLSGDVVARCNRSDWESLDALRRLVAAVLDTSRFRVKLTDCIGEELRESDVIPELFLEGNTVACYCLVLTEFVASEQQQLDLVERIRLEDVVNFEQMLNMGMGVNFVTRHGDAPLAVAAACAGSPEHLGELCDLPVRFYFVQTLLEAGAAMNSPRQDGETALTLAVANGDFHLCKYLLEKKADPNVRSGLETPLRTAASRNNAMVLRLLLAGCAHINAPDLIDIVEAAQYDEWETVSLLYQHGFGLSGLGRQDQEKLHAFRADVHEFGSNVAKFM